tara:strand:+ start:5327 stop:6580 length:1254 start_codon:yes stop_codon:yes gene_type:complete
MSIEIKQKFFNINFLDGLKFSKASRDTNPIHINKLYGYNSMFGENIIHGVLTIIFFLKQLKFKKNFYLHSLHVKFLKSGKYNTPIYIKKKKNNSTHYEFSFLQEEQIITIVDIKILINKNFNQIKINEDYWEIFKKISYYTGVKYPGKNSLLHEIDIEKNEKKREVKDKDLKISSKFLDKRLPFIKNNFLFKDYKIKFISLKRPTIKLKKSKPNIKVTNTISKIKNNVMIIGASQGLGRDLLNLIKKNKKINIVATSFKNRIKIKNKNIKKIRLDVTKDTKILTKHIKRLSPIRIYYFATRKIDFDKKISKKKLKEYENFFINYPLKILSENKSDNLSFFYPSTEFIDFNKNFPYSKIKLQAEKKISEYCSLNNIKFINHRFSAINSRQSASFSEIKNQNLAEYLIKNEKILSKIFL